MQLITPDSGDLLFDGESVGHALLDSPDFRRQVQMVFQDSYASLNPRLTIEDSDRLRAARARRRGQQPHSPARTICCTASGSSRAASPGAIRTSFPAASASASTSRARWRSIRGC